MVIPFGQEDTREKHEGGFFHDDYVVATCRSTAPSCQVLPLVAYASKDVALISESPPVIAPSGGVCDEKVPQGLESLD